MSWGVAFTVKEEEAASPGVPGPGVSERRKNWPVLAVWVGSRHGCSAVLCYKHMLCPYQCEPPRCGELLAV